jgi:hypothetical protein
MNRFLYNVLDISSNKNPEECRRDIFAEWFMYTVVVIVVIVPLVDLDHPSVSV